MWGNTDFFLDFNIQYPILHTIHMFVVSVKEWNYVLFQNFGFWLCCNTGFTFWIRNPISLQCQHVLRYYLLMMLLIKSVWERETWGLLSDDIRAMLSSLTAAVYWPQLSARWTPNRLLLLNSHHYLPLPSHYLHTTHYSQWVSPLKWSDISCGRCCTVTLQWCTWDGHDVNEMLLSPCLLCET